jgi:hypothetical protein
MHAFFRAVPCLSVVVGLLMMAMGRWLLVGRHLNIPLPRLSVSQGGVRYRFLLTYARWHLHQRLDATHEQPSPTTRAGIRFSIRPVSAWWAFIVVLLPPLTSAVDADLHVSRI